MLLSNAFKYRSTQSADIAIRYRFDEDQLQISIRDEGIGINKDEIDKVGNPFFRGRNVQNIKGSGVGFSMVEKIVEGAGGTLAIDSLLGEYTQVSMIIPGVERNQINN